MGHFDFTKPELEQISMSTSSSVPMTMAVCLCTKPLLLEPSGISLRHRPTSLRLPESMDAARARRLLDAAKASPSRLKFLHPRVDRLQRFLAHFAERLDPGRPLPHPWPASRRDAATHGRHTLVTAV